MKRSEDIARELARSGELDPVTEAALTTPFSRRALLLSPIVLGLGLTAAPSLAAATTYGQWVRYESVSMNDGKATQDAYYWVDPNPTSDNRFRVWFRLVIHCWRTYTYGIGFTNAYRFFDGGTYIGELRPPSWELEGKVRNYNWVQYAGDEIVATSGGLLTVPGGGDHHITSQWYSMAGSGNFGSQWDLHVEVPYVGRVTVTLRPLSYRNGTRFSYPSDPSGYRGYMPEGTYLVKLCDDRLKSLNVAGGSADGGANVHLWDTALDASAADRLWDLFREGDGRFECVHHATPCALDLYDAKAQNHQNVQQWPRNGAAPQRWRFDGPWSLGADNTVLIRSKVDDGFMLDVEPSSTSNGSNVDVWDKSDASAVTCWQRWDPHLVNPDEGGAWRDVTELPDSPIRQVNFAGTKLGLYLGDRLVETATVTSTDPACASVTFSTSLSSDTSDWYNVRVLDAPANLRRQGGMHRFYVRGDLDLNVYFEYAKVGMAFKSIDEDGTIRTSASLSSLYSGWPYTAIPIPPDESNGPLNPSLGDEALGELGCGDGWLAVSRYWYDRDPRVAAAKLLEVGDELVITGNETAWMRLPDTVEVHVVGGSLGGPTLWSSGPLKMRDGDTVPGPTTGAGAPPTTSSDPNPLSGPIESDRLWPAVASCLASELCEADKVEGWYLDEACSKRVDAFEVAPHTVVWLRVRPYTVTYVVDGRVMATDEVPVQPAGSRSAWKVPGERTAQAAREGCTPGFSGWALSEDDPLVSGDSPSEGAAGVTELVVTSDVTLYGVNRATVSFARDPGSEVAADGTCLTAPDDGAEAAGAAALGEIEPLTRRVGRSASLPMPSRVYHKTEAGRFVAYAPRAWHATPGSEANSSTAVVSRDMTMYVSWVAGTTDGVAAER